MKPRMSAPARMPHSNGRRVEKQLSKRTLLRGRAKVIAIAAAATLLGAFAAPAAAQGVVGTVPGRVGGSMAAVTALIGVVVGARALRSAGRAGDGSGRDGAIVALVLGLVGVVLAGVHLATSTGGIGTGSGKAGAIVAVVLGVVGVALGRRALRRAGARGSASHG
jgi:hypothetical protein